MKGINENILRFIFEDEKKKRKNGYDVHGDEDDKVVMKGNSVSYVNPNFKSIFNDLNCSNNINAETKDQKQETKKECKDMKEIKFDRSEEYFKAVKVAQECAKEYKDMKKKEKESMVNRFVYIPFALEHSFNVQSDDNDYEVLTHFLGVFTDPKNAEKQCENDIANDACWKVMKGLPQFPYDEDYKMYYKLYRSKYFFDSDLMVLNIKYRIILKVEVDSFDMVTVLSSCNIIEDNTYKSLLDLFRNFSEEHDKLISNFENGIHKLLEK